MSPDGVGAAPGAGRRVAPRRRASGDGRGAEKGGDFGKSAERHGACDRGGGDADGGEPYGAGGGTEAEKRLAGTARRARNEIRDERRFAGEVELDGRFDVGVGVEGHAFERNPGGGAADQRKTAQGGGPVVLLHGDEGAAVAARDRLGQEAGQFALRVAAVLAERRRDAHEAVARGVGGEGRAARGLDAPEGGGRRGGPLRNGRRGGPGAALHGAGGGVGGEPGRIVGKAQGALRGCGGGDGSAGRIEESDRAVKKHGVAEGGSGNDARRVEGVVAGAGERLVDGAQNPPRFRGGAEHGEAQLAAVRKVGADLGDADGDEAVGAAGGGLVGDAAEDDVRCPFDRDALAVRAGHDGAVAGFVAEDRERVAGHGGEHRLVHVGVGVGAVQGDGVRRGGRRHHEEAAGEGAGIAVAVGVHIAAVGGRAALEEVLETRAGFAPDRGAAAAVEFADLVAAEVDHHLVGVDVREGRLPDTEDAVVDGVGEEDEIRRDADLVGADADKRPVVVVAALHVADGRRERRFAGGTADGVDRAAPHGVVAVVGADGVADLAAAGAQLPRGRRLPTVGQALHAGQPAVEEVVVAGFGEVAVRREADPAEARGDEFAVGNDHAGGARVGGGRVEVVAVDAGNGRDAFAGADRLGHCADGGRGAARLVRGAQPRLEAVALGKVEAEGRAVDLAAVLAHVADERDALAPVPVADGRRGEVRGRRACGGRRKRSDRDE